MILLCIFFLKKEVFMFIYYQEIMHCVTWNSVQWIILKCLCFDRIQKINVFNFLNHCIIHCLIDYNNHYIKQKLIDCYPISLFVNLYLLNRKKLLNEESLFNFCLLFRIEYFFYFSLIFSFFFNKFIKVKIRVFAEQ